MNKLDLSALSFLNCNICPRECCKNRIDGKTGYCGTDSGFSISSIVVHHGEEPVISGSKGICNVFFTGCNLNCIYCQNYQISRPKSQKKPMLLTEIIDKISSILCNGIHAVGFVSSSHVVPQIIAIIDELHKNGLYPVTVYNTNAYEKPEIIKELQDVIDVFLPDFKYISSSLSKEYSGAEDYFHYASMTIKEMYRQKGSTLFIDDEGQAESGLMIRHLVLPGHVDESIKVLRYIAEEISTGVHLSLMSQYYPTSKAIHHPILNRNLLEAEYQIVVTELYNLGFRNGWVQQMESSNHYRPDFKKFKPFSK